MLFINPFFLRCFFSRFQLVLLFQLFSPHRSGVTIGNYTSYRWPIPPIRGLDGFLVRCFDVFCCKYNHGGRFERLLSLLICILDRMRLCCRFYHLLTFHLPELRLFYFFNIEIGIIDQSYSNIFEQGLNKRHCHLFILFFDYECYLKEVASPIVPYLI